MTQFIMLMRREWMQHRIGWLLVMLAPTVLLLLASFIDGGSLTLSLLTLT